MTRARQPRRSPKIFSASSTATEPTETLPRVIAVRDRTDFAAAKEDWKSRFSHFPGLALRPRHVVGVLELPENLGLATTIDLRPEATEKRCSTHGSPRSWKEKGWKSVATV